MIDNLVPFAHWLTTLPASERPKTAASPPATTRSPSRSSRSAIKILQDAGIKIVYNKVFPAEVTDYAPIATSVASTKADAFLLGSVDVPTVSAFIHTFIQQHYNPKAFIATAGPDQGAAFLKAIGGASNAEGVMVPERLVSGLRQRGQPEDGQEYVAKYGGNPSDVNADVAEAYSVGQIVAQAVAATHSLDNAKIIAYLHSGVTLSSVQGPVKFDSLGENGAAAAFVVPVAEGQPRAGAAGRVHGLQAAAVSEAELGIVSASSLIKAVIDGILTGGVYALMAAGLTLIFGVMDIINIAQGALIVLGAYMSYVLSVHLGIDLFVGLIITIPAFFVLGVFIEWAFMRRLRDQERTAMSILVTYAVAIIIEGVLSVIFGVDYLQLQAPYVNSTFHLLGFYLPYIYVFGFLLAVALMGVLYYILYRTHFGRGVRGSLQNRAAAELIGVNVNRVRALSVGIGVSVTAAGGMVFGATNSFNPSSGYDLISRLLSIVILAGLGSIGGALIAAIFMVTLEDVVSVVWSPVWATLVYYASLIVVLSFMPNGLFGKAAVRAQ